jgi:hypothetical protein
MFLHSCRSAVVVNAGVSACAQVWCHPDRRVLYACLDPTVCRAGPGRAPSRRSRIRAYQVTLQRIRGIGSNVAPPEVAPAAAAARWRPPRRLVSLRCAPNGCVRGARVNLQPSHTAAVHWIDLGGAGQLVPMDSPANIFGRSCGARRIGAVACRVVRLLRFAAWRLGSPAPTVTCAGPRRWAWRRAPAARRVSLPAAVGPSTPSCGCRFRGS